MRHLRRAIFAILLGSVATLLIAGIGGVIGSSRPVISVNSRIVGLAPTSYPTLASRPGAAFATAEIPDGLLLLRHYNHGDSRPSIDAVELRTGWFRDELVPSGVQHQRHIPARSAIVRSGFPFRCLAYEHSPAYDELSARAPGMPPKQPPHFGVELADPNLHDQLVASPPRGTHAGMEIAGTPFGLELPRHSRLPRRLLLAGLVADIAVWATAIAVVATCFRAVRRRARRRRGLCGECRYPRQEITGLCPECGSS